MTDDPRLFGGHVLDATSSPTVGAGFVESESPSDRQDRGAVGPVLDEGAVGVAGFGDPQAVFAPVLAAALDSTVGDVGGATVTDPLGDVIDLTTRRADVATDVLTAIDHHLEHLTGGTGEQASLASDVHNDTSTVDHERVARVR